MYFSFQKLLKDINRNSILMLWLQNKVCSHTGFPETFPEKVTVQTSNSTGNRGIRLSTPRVNNESVHKSDWDEVSVLVYQSCLWSSCAILVQFVNDYSVLRRNILKQTIIHSFINPESKCTHFQSNLRI